MTRTETVRLSSYLYRIKINALGHFSNALGQFSNALGHFSFKDLAKISLKF